MHFQSNGEQAAEECSFSDIIVLQKQMVVLPNRPFKIFFCVSGLDLEQEPSCTVDREWDSYIDSLLIIYDHIEELDI